MQIKNISQAEFNLLFPNACYIGIMVGRQVEWFADEAQSVLGTIGENRTAVEWLSAVVRRDDTGNFRVTKIASPTSLPGARVELFQAMETI